jgi:hypothetical protein
VLHQRIKGGRYRWNIFAPFTYGQGKKIPFTNSNGFGTRYCLLRVSQARSGVIQDASLGISMRYAIKRLGGNAVKRFLEGVKSGLDVFGKRSGL